MDQPPFNCYCCFFSFNYANDFVFGYLSADSKYCVGCAPSRAERLYLRHVRDIYFDSICTHFSTRGGLKNALFWAWFFFFF